MTNPTINLGSGKWATKEGELLGYSKFNPKEFLPQSFDVSRASSATVVNRDGLIESVANNIARVDFADDVNGALLLEPQGTNLITYSEDFTDSTWIKDSATNVTPNQSNSPEGTLTASLVTSNGSNGLYFNTALSGTFARSIFLKSISGTTSAVLRDPNTASFTPLNLVITNEWKRFVLIGDNQRSSSGLWIDDIDSTGFYIWGAQLEQSSVATSYIPTNGTTVTRLADVVGGAGDVNTFNDSEGVLYAEIAALSDDLTNREISLSDGTTNNRLEIRYSSTSNRMQVISRVNSTIVSNLSFILNNSTDFNKIAFKYKENDFALWINGVEVDTDLSGSTYPTSTLNKISFNNGAGGESFFGKVKDIQYYNTALTDSELTQLTTI
jgi:hypothetical protein